MKSEIDYEDDEQFMEWLGRYFPEWEDEDPDVVQYMYDAFCAGRDVLNTED